MFGSEIKKQIEAAKNISSSDYKKYRSDLAEIMNEYEDKRDCYNNLVGEINNERMALRVEIGKLYDFLENIGNNLGDRITIFKFADEKPAPKVKKYDVLPIDKPDFKDDYYIFNPLLKTIGNHMKNKEMLSKYYEEIGKQELKYAEDLYKRKEQIDFLEDAVEIARIYRNIIVIVRDTIRDKIIPEFGLIKAFLYADAIRERIIEDSDLDDIKPANIVEYKDTLQNLHYQFVENAFDFYRICYEFFSKAILTNIIEDTKITEEEQEFFNKSIEEIKSKISILEDKRVMK